MVNGEDDGFDPCLDLTGTATFLDFNNEGAAGIIQTRYVSTPQGINFTASGLLFTDDRIFEVDNFGCAGNATKPCKLFFAVPTADITVCFHVYSYYASGPFWGAYLTINCLVRRNGYLMKSDLVNNATVPFTRNSPCISYMPNDNYYGNPSEITLCCTRFGKPQASSCDTTKDEEKIDFHETKLAVPLPKREP